MSDGSQSDIEINQAPGVDLAEEPDQKVADWELDGYPWDLWTLFKHELAVDETDEVINRAVVLLAGSGVTKQWQMEELNVQELDAIIPRSEHLREYLVTKRVLSKLQQPAASSSTDLTQLTNALEKLSKRAEGGGSRKRKSPLDPDSDTEQAQNLFQVSQALGRYGLPDIPYQHMPPTSVVAKAAKKAQADAAAWKQFVAPGKMSEYRPVSMESWPAEGQNMTHAQWVAGWWSRALTQLAAQHACEWETFSFQTLLTEFLNMNQVAMDSNVRTAWSYDQEKWTTIHDRVQRYERDLDPQKELLGTTWDAQKRISDGIQAKWQKEKQKKNHKQPWSTQPKGGKGKGDRKSAFTSTASTYVKEDKRMCNEEKEKHSSEGSLAGRVHSGSQGSDAEKAATGALAWLTRGSFSDGCRKLGRNRGV